MEDNQSVSAIPEIPQTPPNVLTQRSHTNMWLWVGIGIVLLVVLLGTGMYINKQEQTKKAAARVAAIIPTFTPSPTPASPSADFVSYNDLDGKEKFAVAYNFSDPLLNAGFAYPPGYYVQSVKADTDHKDAEIFFAANKNASDAALIQQVVTCMIHGRKNPIGVDCRESIIGDVNVSIQPYVSRNGRKEAADSNCEKEIHTKDRILFSCAVPSISQSGMHYILYLLGENSVRVLVSAKNPKEDAHVIRSIISSATNKLN